MALNSMRWSIGAIIGPAIAGVITTGFGVAVGYGVDLVSFAATFYAVFKIGAVPASANAEQPSLQGIFEAWKYALKRQYLLGTYLIDISAMFFAFPQALYPALAVIYGKEYVVSFRQQLLSDIFGSITSGWTRFVNRHGLMVTGGAIMWGIAIAFFGFSDQLWLALTFLVFAGFFDMISGIFRGAVWNQTIPNFLRGRMAGIEMISYLTGPYLGSAKMGIVAEKYSGSTAIISGGILCVAAVFLTALFLPKFLKYDGRDGIAQRSLEEAQKEAEING